MSIISGMLNSFFPLLKTCCYLGRIYYLILSVSNLLDITSQFCTMATFVLTDLYVMFCAQFIGMFMNYHSNRFQMLNCNVSLAVTIKLKFKHPHKLPEASMFYFKKKICHKKSCIFLTVIVLH